MRGRGAKGEHSPQIFVLPPYLYIASVLEGILILLCHIISSIIYIPLLVFPIHDTDNYFTGINIVRIILLR